MFYVALLQERALARKTLTFLFNGAQFIYGMLHMGAFGPKRVVTQTTPYPAPYRIINNDYSCSIQRPGIR